MRLRRLPWGSMMRAFFHARSAVERTHYDTLEVSPKASLEAIKGAYRFLCQKWHPDKNPQGRAEAEQVTRSLNEAYAVLSDPERRAAYDALLTANAYRQARQDSRPRAQARPAGRSSTAGGAGCLPSALALSPAFWSSDFLSWSSGFLSWSSGFFWPCLFVSSASFSESFSAASGDLTSFLSGTATI